MVAFFCPPPFMRSAVESDPHFANVSALLHFDGADGSTTFVDSSSHGATVTPSGDAQIDTAQSVFGGASGLFDGSGDYLTIADDGRFDFPNDFTAEMWLRFADASGTQRLLSGSISAGTGPHLFNKQSDGRLAIGRQGVGIDQASSALSWTVGQWYSVAFSRTSGVLKIFRDGIEVSSASNSNSYSANVLGIGRSATGNYFNGWMDELRITKGVGRYTGNYTPATSAFPNS